VKLGAKIFGILGSVLCLYLLVGLLLPGTWTAKYETVLRQPPNQVFTFLSEVEQWQRWMPLPESGWEVFGTVGSEGSGVRWDDPRYGRGQIQITGTEPVSSVTYRVEVEGGRLVIEGELTLVEEGRGSRLSWEEKGDFGWNPLMGYAARGMGRSQTEAMRASVEDLKALMVGG
jgi:uncharacterized protein YndB with AHSA1/START domain